MGKKNKGKDYKGSLASAVIGGAFFAIPYIGLGVSLLPSLGIGAVAFGAGNLLFSSDAKDKVEKVAKEMTLYDTLKQAKEQNAQIQNIMGKLEDPELVKNVGEIHDTVTKIIDTVSRKPDKIKKTNSFFNYYLPVTLNILSKYDDIENQKLDSKDSEKFMKKTQEMISKINKSFKTQLSNLYQADIIDTDAEMKVFETMLNSEGFDISDFNTENKEG